MIMNIQQVKAPEQLKNKTISMMKAQSFKKTNREPIKVALVAACIPVFFMLTAFCYSLFSGIDGDELAIDANYKGNGIVEITVENLAKKNLQFDETIKLEQWSTSKEIFEIKQEMPVIESGESAVITIEIPKVYVDDFEVPLLDTDWYYFILTTNNFAFGQSWMASLTFAEPIATEKTEETAPPITPVEDNTNEEDISMVKNNFEFQNPLNPLKISCDYNDHEVNGEYAHAEVDLVAELGTDIYPFSNGTVIETGFDTDMGQYIVIDHGDGLVSKYTHCSELHKEQGNIVEMDDVIASVGKTGMATGAHLGFSITLNDIPINPEALLLE